MGNKPFSKKRCFVPTIHGRSFGKLEDRGADVRRLINDSSSSAIYSIKGIFTFAMNSFLGLHILHLRTATIISSVIFPVKSGERRQPVDEGSEDVIASRYSEAVKRYSLPFDFITISILSVSPSTSGMIFHTQQ